MEIVNSTPFQLAPMPGRLTFPGHTLTLIVKGTFDLHPGETVTPSDEQIFPTGEEFYPDDEEMTGSCRYESDYACYKPCTDLLLSGHCHSPVGKPVQACRVTFQAGAHSAILNVFGDRYWKGIPGMRVISDPESFTRMELRYENSFGGPGFKKNPTGKGYRKEENDAGDSSRPLPNIENPHNLVDSPGSRPEPAGFGPLGKMWQQRYSKMGTYSGNYVKERWPWFPLDFDWKHYNAAPPNMQVDGYLRGDEKLYCENLHPQHSLYESRLPCLRVRTFLNRLDEEESGRTKFSEVAVKLDTLWVDMDAEKLILVWRGSTEVLSEEFEEIQHVFIMSEPLDSQPAALERCYELYLKTLAAQEAEWAMEPEEPEEEKKPEEPAIAMPGIAGAGMAVPGLAAAEDMISVEEKPEEAPPSSEEELPPAEAEKIDPETVKAHTKAFLAQAGITMESLPPEVLEKVDREVDRVINVMSEADSSKILEHDKAGLEAGLNETFAKMGIDPENLPPVSEKARQEQVRMMQELGLENAETEMQDTEISKIWNILSALLPKIGIDSDNLTPFIEEAKKQQERIYKNMPVEKTTESTEAEQPAEENRKNSGER